MKGATPGPLLLTLVSKRQCCASKASGQPGEMRLTDSVIRISASVGDWAKKAVNRRADVRTVQSALQAAAESKRRHDFDPGAVDGLIAKPPRDSATVKAIRAFQGEYMREPDGLVDVGGRTLKRLGEFVLPAYPTVRSAPIPASTMIFPLPRRPQYDYGIGARRFGARRSGGKRLHAGCDLIVPLGTNVVAVMDGKITLGPYHFYRGTYALEIRHSNGMVVRYSEVKPQVAPGIARGVEVKQGQVLGYVGKMFNTSMLHIEMYSGSGTGQLTQRGNPPYFRRADLLDPTPYLRAAVRRLPK